MNLLIKLERYLKRIPLAEKMGTNKTYLSVSAQKEELPPGLEARIREAGEEIVAELTNILKKGKRK
jgi:hypothetical protein